MAALSDVVPFTSFELEAAARSVAEVRRRVLAFAAYVGADSELRARVALAVSEAAANVVTHAYHDRRGSRPLGVAADFEDGDLEVVIADEGAGLRPRPSPGPGLGLGIIAETCDEFVVRERDEAGVELWMRFRLDRATRFDT
jgi:anti-sigma regulatory factor (Ser/Thr protein kinase)